MVRLLVLIAAMGFIYPMNAPLAAPIKRDAAIKATAPIAGATALGYAAKWLM